VMLKLSDEEKIKLDEKQFLIDFKKEELQSIDILKQKKYDELAEHITFLDGQKRLYNKQILDIGEELSKQKEVFKEETEQFDNQIIFQKRMIDYFTNRDMQRCSNNEIKINAVKDYTAWECYNTQKITRCVCYYKQCEKCALIDGAAVGIKYDILASPEAEKAVV
jgi:hypothetical protein